MMVTIAIGGILLAIAIGAYGNMREDTRVDSAKEQIASLLQQARLNALSSGNLQTVTFDWANDTVAGIAIDNSIDLQKIACTASPPTLTNTGTKNFTFSRRGTGTSSSIHISMPGSSRVGVITVNGTTGRIAIKDSC